MALSGEACLTLGCNPNLVKKSFLNDLPSGPKPAKEAKMVCVRLGAETDINFTPMSVSLEKLKHLYKND